MVRFPILIFILRICNHVLYGSHHIFYPNKFPVPQSKYNISEGERITFTSGLEAKFATSAEFPQNYITSPSLIYKSDMYFPQYIANLINLIYVY